MFYILVGPMHKICSFTYCDSESESVVPEKSKETINYAISVSLSPSAKILQISGEWSLVYTYNTYNTLFTAHFRAKEMDWI